MGILEISQSAIVTQSCSTLVTPMDFSPPGSSVPVLWPLHAKSWLIGKISYAGTDWEQEEKGTTEDEMAGWHHWLDGNEFRWTPGVGDGQGGLACCNSWGRKELDTTERLNWTESLITPDSSIAERRYSFSGKNTFPSEGPCGPWGGSSVALL